MQLGLSMLSLKVYQVSVRQLAFVWIRLLSKVSAKTVETDVQIYEAR